MNLWRATCVVARRDFVALVATPTFVFFLLAPLIFMTISVAGGLSAGQLASNAGAQAHLVALVPADERAAFVAVDDRLRAIDGDAAAPPRVIILPDTPGHHAALHAWRSDNDVLAILTGPAAHPAIAERRAAGYPGRYLAALAEGVMREGPARAADAAAASQPRFSRIAESGARSSTASRTSLGYAIVFGIFLLMLLLAGQTVGMLAEEKGNKVIEILAAAIPLEALFFGKLVGMVGVAIVFVGFWGLVGGGGTALLAQHAPAGIAQQFAVTPAVGWPLFAALVFAYFLLQFMLLGGMFLGVGAMASTVREIQMLSLPITFLQIGMFALASGAANAPDSSIARLAQLIPWSSPMAMAARAATDERLWPHLAALGWQALWIAITIAVSVRVFRAGVLRSGNGWRGLLRWRRARA